MPDLNADSGKELRAVRERYSRRGSQDARYSAFNPAALYSQQERQRVMLHLLARDGRTTLSSVDLVEVGSGDGANLLEWLRFGCSPERLRGIELLPERHAAASLRLPSSVRLTLGDAVTAEIEDNSCDVVLASTVFSSLLDDDFQCRLARAMWGWLRPGGGVLWYDFTVDNPRNPDVRGVPASRVRTLFPEGCMYSKRVTLAPPISRRVAAVHPSLYTLFNAVPWLRTHMVAWIIKP
jgi:hypothetical protein